MNEQAQAATDMSVSHWPAKVLSAILAALIPGSWSEAAAMAAFFYSFLLISEWFWKRFWRPLLERHGILKRRLRRKEDQ